MRTCEICGMNGNDCNCPSCEKCGRHDRKECTVDHGLMNHYVIRSPLDLAGNRSWILDMHVAFLKEEGMPAPMVSIGRTGVVYVIGGSVSMGMNLPFPFTRHESAMAIDFLRELARTPTPDARRN